MRAGETASAICGELPGIANWSAYATVSEQPAANRKEARRRFRNIGSIRRATKRGDLTILRPNTFGFSDGCRDTDTCIFLRHGVLEEGGESRARQAGEGQGSQAKPSRRGGKRRSHAVRPVDAGRDRRRPSPADGRAPAV